MKLSDASKSYLRSRGLTDTDIAMVEVFEKCARPLRPLPSAATLLRRQAHQLEAAARKARKGS